MSSRQTFISAVPRPRVWIACAAVLALAMLAGLTVASPPAGAVFPGVNGKIACEGLRGPALPQPPPSGGSRSEIFDIDPNVTNERVLTNNQTRDGDPQYSPDGTKIVFEGRRVPGEPLNSEIYVANNDGDLEGPDVQRLTFSPAISGVAATDRQPSWSPDGTEIVFHSGRAATFNDGGTSPANDFEIYKMSAVTGEPGGLTRLTETRGQDAIPAWSPDGSKIAFQTLRENTSGRTQNLEIYTMDPDGSNQANVSNSPGTPDVPGGANENSNGLDSTPTWSPDGQQIAFASTRDTTVVGNQNFEIYRMAADGSDQIRLTANLSGDTPFPAPFIDYDHTPTWSPDGTRVLFTSGRTSASTADDFVVYTMDAADGEAGGLQAVAETDVTFGRCDWQSLPRPAQAPVVPYPAPPAGAPPFFSGCAGSVVNVILGTAGNDLRNGTAVGDRIFTGTGDDVVDGLAGGDCIDLGPGADRGQGGAGNDLVLGGAGSDRLSGSSGNDRIRGNPGNDRINAGRGDDRVFGDTGNDVISGSFGNDRLHGVSGRDRINGSRGRDRINGGGGGDRISGGSSGDRISGDQGSDRISGDSGNDRIRGNSGNDRIRGGSGRDRISGGSGRDRIAVRDGQVDRVNCGSGTDRVTADASDVISSNCESVSRSGASAAAASAPDVGSLGLPALAGAYVALLGWRRRRR